MRVRGVQMTTSSTARAHMAGDNVRKEKEGGGVSKDMGRREGRKRRGGRDSLQEGSRGPSILGELLGKSSRPYM